MDAIAVERLLKDYQFHLISQKGSHRKWRNDDRNLQVIVPMHRTKKNTNSNNIQFTIHNSQFSKTSTIAPVNLSTCPSEI